MSNPPWRIEAGGLLLVIRLTPRGGRDAIDSVAQPLVKLIAKTLDVAVRYVSLVAGASARLKQLRISGAGAALAATLEKICAIG